MAFQKVSAAAGAIINDKPTRYVIGKNGLALSYGDIEEGTVLAEGVFKNAHVDPNGEYGPRTTYYVEAESETIGLSGTSVLNDRMSQVAPGTLVRITYIGLGEKKKGKKPPFLFEVEQEVSEEKSLA